MDAPKEVFALESLNGKIWVHSTKGPLVFEELEDATAALLANNGKLEKKHSVFIVAMTPEMSSAPFRGHKEIKSDLMELPKNSIYLADLRDKVAESKNQKVKLRLPIANTILVTPTGDLDKLSGISPKLSPEDEYLDLRAKLKALGVNVRAIRKLPRLRAMLAQAESTVEEPVTA